MDNLFNLAPILVNESSSNLEEWLTVAEKELGDFHKNRKLEWSLGRYALELAFAEKNIKFEKKNYKFLGFQEMAENPEWIFSLSHSKNWGAALLLPKRNFAGVGLDIELKTRNLTSAIKERMAHAEDKIEGLLLWSIKEAAYKTLPKEIQEKIWLNQIAVDETHFKVEAFAMKGSWRVFEHPELCVVSATRSHERVN